MTVPLLSIDLVDEFLETLSASTARSYRTDLHACAQWLTSTDRSLLRVEGDRTVVASDALGTIQLWQASMRADGLAPATIQRRLSALSGWFRWATAPGGAVDGINPVQWSHLRTGASAERTSRPTPILSQDQFVDFVRSSSQTTSPLTDLPVVTFLGFTGVRVSEAIALNADDLDSNDGITTIKSLGKNGLRRRIVVPPESLRLLGDRREGPFLRDAEGERYTRQRIQTVLSRVQRSSSLSDDDVKVTPHVLRATWTNLAARSGTPLVAIQEALGHADIRQTLAYARVSWSSDIAAAQAQLASTVNELAKPALLDGELSLR